MRLNKSNLGDIAFRSMLLLLDAVLITGWYLLILWIREPNDFLRYVYPEVIMVIVPVTLITLGLFGAYDPSTDMLGLRFLSEHLIASLIALVVSASIIYSAAAYGASLSPGRASVITTLLLFTVTSLVYRRELALWQVHKKEQLCLYVLGAGESAAELYRMFRDREVHQELYFFDITGRNVGMPVDPQDPDSPKVLEDILGFKNNNRHEIEAIVIAEEPTRIPNTLLEDLVRVNFNEVSVQTLDTYCSRRWKVIPVVRISPLWGFDRGFRLNQSLTYDRGKRIADICLSLAALLALLPIMLVIAVIIKRDSKGPAIFRQTRVGQNERHFTLYKFRTMSMGADNESKYTQKDDERITRAGSFLRKTRLDELPQLWNVLRGDMSIIGPRAEWTELVKDYESKILHYHFRHLVRPGITGWAQVNYSYGMSKEDTIEKLKYDLYYVRHYSFLLDLSIILKTIYILAGAKGQ